MNLPGVMTMTSRNRPASPLQTLLDWSRDPQAWISMLAVLTVLGVGSGALESADRPSEAALHVSQTESPSSAQSSPASKADEQLASLDISKL
jgi:hypothetical protein